MAVAAPALAIVRLALAEALAAVFLAACCPVLAQERKAPCQPALPELRSKDGQDFKAHAYGTARWMQHVPGGKYVPYAMHVWKGRINGRPAYLTFDEIPGTSGPNYHMDYRLKPVPAKFDTRADGVRFAFDARFVVYDGPLRGEWSLRNCDAP